MSFFGKNIKKIRNVKGLSQHQFAELFDLKRGTVGAYEEGRSEPKTSTIIKVANYFSILIDDLLTTELTVNTLLQFKGDITLQEESIYDENFKEIPCITENNQSDYIKYHTKKAFINQLPTLYLPIHQKKEYRAYTILNLEMTNYDQGLFPKDIVIGDIIAKSNYKKVDNGTLVLVIIDKKIIVRRLYITEHETILRADHKSIDNITIDLNSIKEMWQIRFVFFHRTPKLNNDFDHKLNFLEQEILKLKSNNPTL